MADALDTAPQTLNPTLCYPALVARDARFDGQWFVAVRSTGVYCRPVCRVRTPLARNCQFFRLAAGAEAAGYRPCLKCRPELAPGAFSQMEARHSLAQAARARLDAGLDASLTDLAARVGVTDRHLRRLFHQQLGVTPQQYQQTQRLLLAKRLLTDTRLPITEVALRAGFGSTRAFQHAWRAQYRLTPGSLRREPERTGSLHGESLQLAFRPPYATTPLLRFFAARAVPGVEHVDVDGRQLIRNLRVDATWGRGSDHGTTQAVGQVSITFAAAAVQVQASPQLWRHTAALLSTVRQWLDLDADAQTIATHLRANGLHLEAGLRLPGCPDRLELAVRALLGQQVTVAAARTLATRLVDRFGDTLPAAERLHPDGPTRIFPSATRLAHASLDRIAALGLPQTRARAIQELARAWPRLAFAQALGSPEDAEAELQQLPGIGPWTAAYMLMRGWPWPDRFLPGDVVLKKRLAEHPGLCLDACAPYRSYAVLQLWNSAP